MSIDGPRLMVSGTGGHLGRRVVELLLEKGQDVVAGSRDIGRIADLGARGAELRGVDFADPASLPEAFAGIDRLLVISTDVLDENRVRFHANAVAAAVAAGVGRIVYTSMANPEPGSPIPFAPDHYRTEEAIRASGMSHTILRNTWYTENLLQSLPQVLASGRWVTAAGEGRVAHVTREDCAQAAAGALAAADAKGVLTVTGPAALTTAELAAIASDLTGRPVAVVNVSDAEYAAGLRAAQLPEPVVQLIVAFDANTRAGRIGEVTDAVEALSGRKPQSVRDFLASNRAALG